MINSPSGKHDPGTRLTITYTWLDIFQPRLDPTVCRVQGSFVHTFFF